jgi:hypothetical protein
LWICISPRSTANVEQDSDDLSEKLDRIKVTLGKQNKQIMKLATELSIKEAIIEDLEKRLSEKRTSERRGIEKRVLAKIQMGKDKDVSDIEFLSAKDKTADMDSDSELDFKSNKFSPILGYKSVFGKKEPPTAMFMDSEEE